MNGEDQVSGFKSYVSGFDAWLFLTPET